MSGGEGKGPDMTPFTFQRGETIALALDALGGDTAVVTAITADLKAAHAGRTSVLPDEPVAASFTVSTRAPAGDTPGGWTLVLSAAQSAGLLPGHYLADARLVTSDQVIVTEPVALRIRAAVTQ